MKNVLISCATSGMGCEIARELSVDTNLVLAARNQDKLALLGSDLKSTQTRSSIQTLPLDFFDSAPLLLWTQSHSGSLLSSSEN